MIAEEEEKRDKNYIYQQAAFDKVKTIMALTEMLGKINHIFHFKRN